MGATHSEIIFDSKILAPVFASLKKVRALSGACLGVPLAEIHGDDGPQGAR